MFKARLIDHLSYAPVKRKQILLSTVAAIFNLFLIIILFTDLAEIGYQSPIWFILAVIVSYGSATILLLINTRKFQKLTDNQLIEIDDECICIKSKNGSLKEVISLDEVEKITVKARYEIPEGSMSRNEVMSDLRGDRKNYLIVSQEGQEKQFDFVIDSNYMLTQLNKVVEIWESKGVAFKETA